MLLLLCQAAVAAQACAHGFVSDGPATAAPCHEAKNETGSTGGTPAAVSVCDAPAAAADASKLPIFDITDFPVLAVGRVDIAPSLRWNSVGLHAVDAVCHSPPLTLLYCRLLN